MTTRDYGIKVVKLALVLLEALANSEAGLGVREGARLLDMSANSAFRLFRTLESAGYVRKDPSTKKYSLTLKMFQLGNAAFHGTDLREIAHPTIQQLSARFQETVSLAVLEGSEILFIGRVESPRSLRAVYPVGSRLYAHCNALGKSMLAFLPCEQIDWIIESGLVALTEHTITDGEKLRRELELTRQRGYAVDDEEGVEGVVGVGAPVFDSLGCVVAALAIGAPRQRLCDPDLIKEIGVMLVEAGYELSGRLGYTGPRPPMESSHCQAHGQAESLRLL